MEDGRKEERRIHKRLTVHGGNAEVLSVFGRGKRPKKRARVVDWSPGGIMLRVESPTRRFMMKADPIMFEMDSVTCCLRLPPTYKDIPISGTVVHVERDEKDAGFIKVGLAFDADLPQKYITEMNKIFEKRPRKSSRVGRVSSRAGRVISGRLGRTSSTTGKINSSRLKQKAITDTVSEHETEERKSRKTDRLPSLTDSERRILEREAERSKSRRLEKQKDARASSKRIPNKVTIVPTESQRASKQETKSKRLSKKSQRLRKEKSQRLKQRKTARMKKAAESKRLEEEKRASERLLATGSAPLLIDSGSEGLSGGSELELL